MTLPDGPVPEDVYGVCKALISKSRDVSRAEKRLLVEWSTVEKPERYAAGMEQWHRELAAKVVIHASEKGRAVVCHG